MQNFPSLIYIAFCIVGLVFGIFFLLKPALAIEIQRKFYARINWRIEPLSMQKELTNTRLMGAFLVILVIAAAILFLPILRLNK